MNWKLARELTKRLAGEREPIDPGLAEEYLELARAADLRIEAASSLPAPSPGDLNPTDRSTWAVGAPPTGALRASKFTPGEFVTACSPPTARIVRG